MSQPVQPRPLIRPYPTQYIAQWKLNDGAPVTIRPIRPGDESPAIDFYQKLSDRSIYLRYFRGRQVDEQVTHETLSRICHIDYGHEMVLVVFYEEADKGCTRMIAGARLIKLLSGNEAEFAIIVADEFQRRGLGAELCRRLLAIARTEGVARVICTILPENTAMCSICSRLGFQLVFDPKSHLVQGEITL
jgi:acetyltransferase